MRLPIPPDGDYTHMAAVLASKHKLLPNNTNEELQSLANFIKGMVVSMEGQPITSYLKKSYKIAEALGKEAMMSHPAFDKVTCTKGCSHCCYQLIEATEVETQVAMEYAKKVKFKVSKKHLQKQNELASAPYATSPLNDTWKNVPHKYRKCVFLKSDNTCAVYPMRPYSCRSYFVTSNPSDCDLSGESYGGDISHINIGQFKIAFFALCFKSDAGYLHHLVQKKIK